MKRLLIAFVLALVMIAVFAAPALADTPPKNFGYGDVRVDATSGPGALAAVVKGAQEMASDMGMNLGQFVGFVKDHYGFIPGHQK